MSNFATLSDLEILWRSLREDERAKAEKLLEVVSDSLRGIADSVGKDLDEMIEDNRVLGTIAKSVTVDIVGRALMTSTDSEPLSQFSEAGMGYSVSGTFLNPGGGLFITDKELKRLGLKRQKIGVIDLWGSEDTFEA